MSGPLQHYCLSLLGCDLNDTLDELIANQMFEEQYRNLVLDHFGRALTEALATQVRSRACIKGVIDHYRNHDDIWRFVLKNFDMKIDGRAVVSNAKTEMIAVSKRAGI